MSRIYKVCIVGVAADGANEVFAIKPYLESFDSFKEEIFIRMPELKNQSIKIYYQDSDGDRITIFNALDFGIFQESKINKVFVVKNAVASGSAPLKTVQFVENQSKSEAQADLPSNLAHKVFHANVICDGCDKEIYGYRYKCLECVDFDLCMDCESRMGHKQHVMIRIADPSDADLAFKSKLGKRFFRHRRSDSLCSKHDEKTSESKRHHHKRQSTPTAHFTPRPNPIGDIVSSVLQSIQSMQQNAKATTNKDDSKTDDTPIVTSGGPKSGENGNKNESVPTAKTPQNTPVCGTPLQDIPNLIAMGMGNAAKKPSCPPLRNSIDLFSNMAQNFAAMMDPFAVYVGTENVANGQASASASATATTPNEGKKSMEKENDLPKEAKNDATKADGPSTFADTVPVPKSKEPEAMVVDCSDDDGQEGVHNLVAAINGFKQSVAKDKAQEPLSAKDDRAASVESDKASPLRDWTFIEVDDSSQSSSSAINNTGAIPKRVGFFSPSMPLASSSGANTGNQIDYKELSRLLSSHIIDAQKQNSTVAAPEVKPVEVEKPSAPIVPTPAVEVVKPIEIEKPSTTVVPPPAVAPPPNHPDKRINDALHAMMSMGFSNEGGWLTQLLESVNGNIPNALDLLQPQK